MPPTPDKPGFALLQHAFQKVFKDWRTDNQHGFWVRPEPTGRESAIYLKQNESSQTRWKCHASDPPQPRGLYSEIASQKVFGIDTDQPA